MHAVDCRHVSKSYGERLVLDDVTMVASGNQVTGLLGPNGAGKTTLIRVLTTLLAPDDGTFEILGHTDPLAIRSVVGVLPESAGFPRRKRAADFLAYHGALYGRSWTTSRREGLGLLDEVGLGDRASDRIGSLSRGMRQRLGIARALINDPAVVFLDEPTLGLDPAGQRDVLELVRRLADQRGAAIVVTSHLLDEIERVCDRATILDRGRVVFDATVTAGLADTFLAVTG